MAGVMVWLVLGCHVLAGAVSKATKMSQPVLHSRCHIAISSAYLIDTFVKLF
jgi:hypothetical protein